MRHLRLASCGSTNDEAKRRLGEGLVPPFLVSTAEQTAGRGREGRSWSHPKGNFAGSFALTPPQLLKDEPGLASLLSGLSVIEALQHFGASEADLQVKWPNDVLLAERKVAGILAEMVSKSEEIAFVIGIGVNLVQPPREARFPAAAVFSKDSAPDEAAFGDMLAEKLLQSMAFAQENGSAALRSRFKARAWRIGQSIAIGSGQGAASGLFEDIDPHGRILLRLADGSFRTISAGDVSHG
ncbi:biotin--[acetyl-CoA-carboxylase] ligase [Parvularcula maris]|uniref:biotin--[biotin carboxyl-carrier protein] ligase n=1 Tax=Parvularcula maris TaxID=2965077 RepID=A0A9X2RGX2_9PROT|nr:biotin--[acetyl-CoA-carboxylase] ligase [Parvularcula maris]